MAVDPSLALTTTLWDLSENTWSAMRFTSKPQVKGRRLMNQKALDFEKTEPRG